MNKANTIVASKLTGGGITKLLIQRTAFVNAMIPLKVYVYCPAWEL